MLLATACSTSGLAFRQDERVDIVSPADRAEVRLPFELRWMARDVAIGPGQGSFGVVIDRAPPPPGETLAWLVEDDQGCLAAEGCPDADYLAARNIFQTTATSLMIERVTDTGVEGRRERHEATVILLDAGGRRRGESAFGVEFEVRRD